MESKRRQLIVLAPVVVLASCASVWVAIRTSDHMLAGADSAVYLGTAGELRAWHGPTVPSTYFYDTYAPQTAVNYAGHVPSSHFPPGYPIALALVSSVTGGTRSAARALGVTLVFVNVVLLGVLTARLTAYRSAIITVVPVALVLFVPDWSQLPLIVPGWLQLHVSVYSEPLFTALVTGALLATATALGPPSPRTTRAAGLAVTLAAGALFTRYVGAAAVLMLPIAFALVRRDQRTGPRFVRGVVLGCLAVLPTYAFVAWSIVLGGRSARILTYHPARGNGELARRLGMFFFPIGWPAVVRTTGLAFVALLTIVGSIHLLRHAYHQSTGNDERNALQHVAILFVILYIGLVFFTRTFLDVATPFDARMLAPIRGVMYAIVVSQLYRVAQPRLKKGAATALIVLLCAGLVYSDWSRERLVLRRPEGPAHVTSRTEQALAALPADALVVTNAPDIALLYSGRGTYFLGGRYVYVTGQPNTSFEYDLQRWAPILASRDSYAFFVGTLSYLYLTQGARADDLARETPLQLISQSGDEQLYRVSRAAG